MSELSKFRSAIGGFHRGDVAEYIERTARQHREALAAAETKAEKAAAEIAALQAAVADAQAERNSLRAILEKLEAVYAEAKAALAEAQ